MASPDRVVRAAEALDDDTMRALVSALDNDERRGVAGLLRITASAFGKASRPGQLVIRSLRRLPPPDRAEVGQMLTSAALDDAIEELGDDADDPTADQLLAALGVTTPRHGIDVTRLMLAATAASDAPARDACAEILDGDGEYALPAVESDATPRIGTKRARADTAEAESRRQERRQAKQARKAEQRAAAERREAAAVEIRERQRVARKEMAASRTAAADAARAEAQAQSDAEAAAQVEREARRAAAMAPDPGDAEPSAVPSVARNASSPRPEPAPPPEPVPVTADGFVTVTASAGREFIERRSVTLIGDYGELIDDDPLLGTLVIVTIAYSDGSGHKARPAVVVGAQRLQLVVRPCYSYGGTVADDWRSVPIGDWRDAGLDGPSWVAEDEVLIARSEIRDQLGRLTAADWNQL